VGDEDEWLDRVQQLHDALAVRGVDHEWHIWSGDHDGDYWTSHISDYLRYYDAALHRERRS
jgi:enterochelin esterase-like enzyme